MFGMCKEAFRPISLSFLHLGLLPPERHLQVRNLTSTCLAGCRLGCSGYMFPSGEPMGMPGGPWVRLRDHIGGAETTNRPHLSSSARPHLPWTSTEASSLPPLTLCPLPFSRAQQTEWVFKMSSCWCYFPVALPISGFPLCPE